MQIKGAVIDWQAPNRHVNSIENLIELLARNAYDHGLQFSIIQELNQQVDKSSFSLQAHILHALIHSMTNRITRKFKRMNPKFEFKFTIFQKSIYIWGRLF